MPAEENKAVFRRYIEEVQNQGNLEVADEIFGHYISHQSDGSTLERGPEDVKRFTEEYRSAFPDWRISTDEQIAEGDRVVNRVTLRGTHQRQFRDMAPTGKEVDVTTLGNPRHSDEPLQSGVSLHREWLSYAEASELLGPGRTTLWKLAGAGEIEVARVGRAVRISWDLVRSQ